MADMARIEIDLRDDGLVGMRSAFMGRRDSTYTLFAQERLPIEAEKLARELRAQMVAALRERLTVSEAALATPTSSPAWPRPNRHQPPNPK